MNALQDELDRSFGDGPPLAPAESHVRAGRRALMRRRAASGVAGLTATAVLATGWYALSPNSPANTVQLAIDNSSLEAPRTSAPAAAPAPDPSQAPWARRELIRYADGELQTRPGLVVHEHLKNPYGYESPGRSDALDVTWKGKRKWLLIEKQSASRRGSSSSSEPSNGWANFAAYVADHVSGSGAGWPDTMQLTDAGEIVATAGTDVLERTDDPQLGDTFAPPGATTGAALVSVGPDERYFVVWRVLDGALDVITTAPDDIADAAFDDLLTAARAKYASGEGLR